MLHHMSGFEEEQVETLLAKVSQYSARLLKKPDQCRAVARASYMFWSTEGELPYRDGKRVLECLQRALKIADACKVSNQHTVLFVEILDAYLFHFSQAHFPAPPLLSNAFPSRLSPLLPPRDLNRPHSPFCQGNELVTAGYINSLMQLIERQLLEANTEATPALALARQHFENTRQLITMRKENEPEKFAEIA